MKKNKIIQLFLAVACILLIAFNILQYQQQKSNEQSWDNLTDNCATNILYELDALNQTLASSTPDSVSITKSLYCLKGLLQNYSSILTQRETREHEYAQPKTMQKKNGLDEVLKLIDCALALDDYTQSYGHSEESDSIEKRLHHYLRKFSEYNEEFPLPADNLEERFLKFIQEIHASENTENYSALLDIQAEMDALLTDKT